MTFWYLLRSTDTFFLVVYEPYRVLEGLQGVRFQGKKKVQNWSQISPKLRLGANRLPRTCDRSINKKVVGN